MIVKLIRGDTGGATLVEFTVTFPLFLLLMFGLIQAGLLLYTHIGLQHGVEMAARCASVNYAANQVGLDQSCFAVAPNAVTNTTIQQYAAQHSWGIVPSSSIFTVTPPTSGGVCGTDKGYVVTVTHTYNLMNYIFSAPLTATSCFPISVS